MSQPDRWKKEERDSSESSTSVKPEKATLFDCTTDDGDHEYTHVCDECARRHQLDTSDSCCGGNVCCVKGCENETSLVHYLWDSRCESAPSQNDANPTWIINYIKQVILRPRNDTDKRRELDRLIHQLTDLRDSYNRSQIPNTSSRSSQWLHLLFGAKFGSGSPVELETLGLLRKLIATSAVKRSLAMDRQDYESVAAWRSITDSLRQIRSKIYEIEEDAHGQIR